MAWIYLLFAFAAGAVLPFQAGINAELARWLHLDEVEHFGSLHPVPPGGRQ